MRETNKTLWYGACSLIVVAIGALLTGCPQKAEPVLKWDDNWNKMSLHPSCGEISVQTLTAGRTIYAGSVIISNDVDRIYVTYAADAGWVLDALHVHVGFSSTDYPGYGSGNNAPVPGQFAYNSDNYPDFVSGTTYYTFRIALTDIGLQPWNCDIPLYIFAHADVSLRDENNNVIQSETAWGGDTPGQHSNRWYFVARFTLQCCATEGEGGEEGAVEGEGAEEGEGAAIEGEGAEEGEGAAIEGEGAEEGEGATIEGEGAEEGEGATIEGEGAEEGEGATIEGEGAEEGEGATIEGEGAEEGEGAAIEGEGAEEGEGAAEGEGEGEEICCDTAITELVLEYFRSCTAMVHIYPMNMALGPLFAGNVEPGQQITLQGSILAPEIYIFVNYQVDSKIVTDCTSDVGPGLMIGDFRVVSGKSANGRPLCPVIREYQCGACQGGVTELTFKYFGNVECIPLAVMPAHSIIPFFWGCVEPNHELTVNGPGVNGLFPPEVSVWVGNKYVGNLDTSCGTEIGAGCTVIGPMLITGGQSLNGGYFCPCQP